MRKILFEIRWHYLQFKRKKLIPEAYFDEEKRVKLCRIDEKLVKLKRRYYYGE